MIDLDRLETDLYNEIMEMRAKEKKRDEDRENTIKTLKFVSVIGMYIIAAVLVLAFLLMFLRHQFPEYFSKTNFSTDENPKSQATDKNLSIGNVRPVSQNVVINIYNNGVLKSLPIAKYKDGNHTVVDIGKPTDKKKTIEEMKKEILDDKSLTEEEKKKKILDLFSTRSIRYAGKFADDRKKSKVCSNAVIDSVNSENIALKAYERGDLKALSKAIVIAAKNDKYSGVACKNVMSNEQLKANIDAGEEHLELLRSYELKLKAATQAQ